MIKWPQIALNGTSLRTLASLSERFGIRLDWDSEQVEVKSLSSKRKRIFLSFNGLDFATTDSSKRAHAQRLEFTFEFEYKRGHFYILEMGPVIVEGQAFLDLKKSDAKPKKTIRTLEKRSEAENDRRLGMG